MEIAKAALAAGIVLAILDALWLGVIARDWLVQQMGELRRPDIQWVPAVGFYLLFAVALGFFAVAPAMEAGDWLKAAMLGGFLGLVAYGTYDLTNWATLKNWPVLMVFVDMAWGVFVGAASAAGGLLLLKGIGWA